MPLIRKSLRKLLVGRSYGQESMMFSYHGRNLFPQERFLVAPLPNLTTVMRFCKFYLVVFFY